VAASGEFCWPPAGRNRWPLTVDPKPQTAPVQWSRSSLTYVTVLVLRGDRPYQAAPGSGATLIRGP